MRLPMSQCLLFYTKILVLNLPLWAMLKWEGCWDPGLTSQEPQWSAWYSQSDFLIRWCIFPKCHCTRAIGGVILRQWFRKALIVPVPELTDIPALNLLKILLWRETLMAKTAPGSLTGRDFYHLIFFSSYWCRLEKQKFLKFKELALDKSRLKPELSHIKQLLPYNSGIFHG